MTVVIYKGVLITDKLFELYHIMYLHSPYSSRMSTPVTRVHIVSATNL